MAHSQDFILESNGYWHGTANGYQLGGNDDPKLYSEILTLSNAYDNYNNNYIILTIYSAVSPSDWHSSFSFKMEITIDNIPYEATFSVAQSTYFSSKGNNQYQITIKADEPLYSGDEIQLYFNGNGFVNGSDRCIYM